MQSLQERVAYLEGRGEEHAGAIGEVRHDVRELRAEMLRRFERVDGRFDAIDNRFSQIDDRFRHIDDRFAHIDHRFNWLVGLQFAILLAIVGLLGSIPR